MADVVRFEIRGAAAWLTIDRPERRNALSPEVIEGLLAGLSRSASAAEDGVRCVVITGEGVRAFSAGGDLGAGGLIGAEGRVAEHDRRARVGELLSAIRRHPQPVIARVNGVALAGGFGLMLACDLVVALDTAEFGTPEVDVGLWPFMISAVLQRNLPRKVALEMMMTGRRVTAAEAERHGFVNRLAPADGLDAAVEELVRVLTTKSPLILRLGKESLRRAEDMPFEDALAYLAAMLTVEMQSEDLVEGVSAFIDKRSPDWTGR